MATVRISSDWGHPKRMEWCGAPTVDMSNHIDRSVDIPEDAYRRIESGIVQGYGEGVVFLDDGSRFEWFLDRSNRESPHKSKRLAPQPAAVPQANVIPTAPEAFQFCPHCGAKLQQDQPGETGSQVERPTDVPLTKPGGWVLAEFPVAEQANRDSCRNCGKTLVQTNPQGPSKS